ncbi:hypothetical protein AVEN_228791-1 [Araneus ventricosus]|uniref:Uncharacterized protein n=1 Tax=Araneus ventricosus TaxID=182803 RepID=A0A4Y2KXJ6_ARAVE|nr:hypothetical protein AVEN_228791-1 [Araneus ventricosus]
MSFRHSFTVSSPPVFVNEDMGRKWVRAVIYSTIQRQHSPGNRPDVLGTSDPELANQGHAMSKHSRARSHHSLYITDPHWATPAHDPTGPIENTALPGSHKNVVTDPCGPTKGLQPGSGCHIFNT